MEYQMVLGLDEKINKSVKLLQGFEPPEGYYLCFSGGKDSVVIKTLADMAGVKYDAHFNVTSADPPEVIRFIRESYPDVEFDYPRYKDGTRITMWNLIPLKRMPPTRIARYCCQYLKEHGGEGRFCVTGVRWAESVRRRTNRHMYEQWAPRGNATFYDNVEDAKQMRICNQWQKRILNPILDWSNDDVWAFIMENHVPYCSLYDEGQKRIGCIGCPMQTGKRREKEFERWPKYKALYMRAFEKMLKEREKKGLKTEWHTAQEVYEWWIERK